MQRILLKYTLSWWI